MHNLRKNITCALFAGCFYPVPQVVCANFAPTTFNTQKMRVVLFGHSPNRIPTKLLPFTILAVLPNPNRIELAHGLLNQLWIVGEDARFEVARTVTFHADACTSEVGTANISHLPVKDKHLEMHPWTKCPFQAFKQGWVFVEVLTEGRARLLGMNEPYLNAFLDELSQDGQEGLSLRAYLDIQVFYVGSANP